MRWQKAARLVIAAFVIVFVAVVVVALRRPAPADGPATTPRTHPDTIAETRGGTYTRHGADGKETFTLDFEDQLTYPDGRNILKNATIRLPEQNGRSINVTGGEMQVAMAEGGGLSTVNATHGVKLEGSDGLVVTSDQASFDEKSGILTAPGDVQFARGRMTGSGTGATYDRNRDVLWLLAKARIDVTPDPTGGGAIQATAGSAGLARAEHYISLAGGSRIVTDGRTLAARDMTIHLTEDDRAVRTMALRGDSRITGGRSGASAEDMAAQDIDLTYSPDGRTLQQAKLVQKADVQLAGAGGKRITARLIDLHLGPDGSTVTTLNADENVQLSLPAAGTEPARRIDAATLRSGGPEGIQTAAFGGGVTFKELRAGGRGAPPAERTGRSQTLVIETQPGLGDIKQADFRGNVQIHDGGTSAEGKRAIYHVAADAFDLIPSPGDAGPPSSVNDGRVLVNARTVKFTVGTRKLEADTDVRSSLQPQARGEDKRQRAKGSPPAAGKDGGRLPSMLKENEPVNVTANRLAYDGAAGLATYEGDARLFQGQTQIQADTIIIDDRTGNLTARGRVRSIMFFEETDAKTTATRLVPTRATSETLVYTEDKRIATYTAGPSGKANVVGPQGDVTADRIELFLKEGSNELERAEAHVGVTAREGARIATGNHLIYTTADETYVMNGSPVEIEEKTPGECRVTVATSVTFRKSNVDTTIKSNGISPARSRPCAAPAGN